MAVEPHAVILELERQYFTAPMLLVYRDYMIAVSLAALACLGFIVLTAYRLAGMVENPEPGQIVLLSMTGYHLFVAYRLAGFLGRITHDPEAIQRRRAVLAVVDEAEKKRGIEEKIHSYSEARYECWCLSVGDLGHLT